MSVTIRSLMRYRSNNAFEFAKDILPAFADALGSWLGGVVIISAICPHEGNLEMQV